jgi:hypothetical protein
LGYLGLESLLLIDERTKLVVVGFRFELAQLIDLIQNGLNLFVLSLVLGEESISFMRGLGNNFFSTGPNRIVLAL